MVYVATAQVWDDEMRRRVARHRADRPAEWRTLEAPTRLAEAIERAGEPPGTVLLDDLGNLVANVLFDLTGGDEPGPAASDHLEARVVAEIGVLDAARRVGGWDLVVVTNEVGLGVVPATPVGRIFRDALGRANQQLATLADAVYLLVAGQPLRIKPACPACAEQGWP